MLLQQYQVALRKTISNKVLDMIVVGDRTEYKVDVRITYINVRLGARTEYTILTRYDLENE